MSKLTHRNNKGVNNHSLYQTSILGDHTQLLTDIKNNTADLDINTDGLETALTDGSQKSQVLGNTAGDGTGDSKHLLTDTDGRLQVDIITGAGGDATAANQTTTHTKLDTIETTLNSIETINTDAESHLGNIQANTNTNLSKVSSIDGKISKGNDDSILAATGAQQVLAYGRNDGNGNLYALKTGVDGNLHVHDADVTSGSDATISSGQQVLTYARSTESGNTITAVACDDSGVLSVDSSKFTQGYDATVSSGGSGLFQTLAYGRDSSGNLDALNVDNNGHLKIAVDTVENKGSQANVQNGTLNFGNSSSSVDVSDFNHAVFLYEDTNTSTFDNPKVEVSVNDTDFYELSTQPLINTGSSKRTGTQEYKLHGIKYLRISNNSTADNFTNAKATIVGTPN